MLFISLFIQGVGLLVYIFGDEPFQVLMQRFIDVVKIWDFLLSVLFS